MPWSKNWTEEKLCPQLTGHAINGVKKDEQKLDTYHARRFAPFHGGNVRQQRLILSLTDLWKWKMTPLQSKVVLEGPCFPRAWFWEEGSCSSTHSSNILPFGTCSPFHSVASNVFKAPMHLPNPKAGLQNNSWGESRTSLRTLQEASEISTLWGSLGKILCGFYSKSHGGEL